MSPANKKPENMSATEALLDYGYVKGDDGVYEHPHLPNGQLWIEVEGKGDAPGGFTRLDVAPAVAGGAIDANVPAAAQGQPWGRPYGDRGRLRGLLEVPYTVDQRWENVSGLHPLTHAECFNWVWPAEKVAELYAFAYKSDRPAYAKVTEGEGDDAREVMVEDPKNKLGR